MSSEAPGWPLRGFFLASAARMCGSHLWGGLSQHSKASAVLCSAVCWGAMRMATPQRLSRGVHLLGGDDQNFPADITAAG